MFCRIFYAFFFVKDLSSPTIIGDLFQLQMTFNCIFFLDLVYQIHIIPKYFRLFFNKSIFEKRKFKKKESFKKRKIPKKEKFQKRENSKNGKIPNK